MTETNAITPPAASHPHSTPGTQPFVHVLSFKLLFGIFVALIILTFVTTGVSDLNLGGALSIYAALAIAVIKSVLVVLFFMHLKYDKPFNALVFCIALFFVALFISVAITDGKAYHHYYTQPEGKVVLHQ